MTEEGELMLTLLAVFFTGRERQHLRKLQMGHTEAFSGRDGRDREQASPDRLCIQHPCRSRPQRGLREAENPFHPEKSGLFEKVT